MIRMIRMIRWPHLLHEAMTREALPVDTYLDRILATVREHRALVLTAEPGAGKTTRVAPALAVDGPLILLQPRRVAARAIAAYIAAENGWTVGKEIGWQVRFDRRYASSTQLLVATEGILTARLQSDPLLSSFRTIVLDEFHERTVHADLALAMARQAMRARDDLRLVVMSATLDTAAVSSFLDDCPVIHIPGRVHPIEITHTPNLSLTNAVEDLLDATPGQILCFLPGAPEIRRALADLAGIARRMQARLMPLHGTMEAEAQDAAIRHSTERRIILATNIAETSLTVPDVTAVIDSGLHKVARFDPRRGLDMLVTERIPQDCAAQRAGRAGRLRAGLVRRLWDSRDILRPHREPEIRRIDLSPVLLDVLAWGGVPETFEWFEAPSDESLQAAWNLLERLGAATHRKLTPVGARLQQLPVHPRLGSILLAAQGARDAARICAILSEQRQVPSSQALTSSDLLPLLESWPALPQQVHRAAREIERIARQLLEEGYNEILSEDRLRKAVFAGYPDRLAKRRSPASDRFLMCNGHGAMLTPESGVRSGEFLVALDVLASERGAGAEARIRIASLVDWEWIQATDIKVEHFYDEEAGQVRAMEVELYDRMPLSQRPVVPDARIAAGLLAEAKLRHGLNQAEQRLIHRLRFAGRETDVPQLVRRACAGATRIQDIHLSRCLSRDLHHELDRLAPEKLQVPSGRFVRLEYADDGSVFAAVKLQELFGLSETPRLGPRNEAVLLVLLAPNGRPVQQTRDLRSFWERGYLEVRKELRARYPKHPWPEDPWSAVPTARPKRRH